jgi:hypothetical protein
MQGLGSLEVIVVLFIAAIIIFPFWKIFSKAGFPGWYGLLILIPVGNIIMLLFLAFAEWPVLRKNSAS